MNMKAFVAIALLFLFAVLTVKAGSVKKRVSSTKEDSKETEWPNPETISNFPVPESFVNTDGADTGNETEMNNDELKAHSSHERAKSGHRHYHHHH